MYAFLGSFVHTKIYINMYILLILCIFPDFFFDFALSRMNKEKITTFDCVQNRLCRQKSFIIEIIMIIIVVAVGVVVISAIYANEHKLYEANCHEPQTATTAEHFEFLIFNENCEKG